MRILRLAASAFLLPTTALAAPAPQRPAPSALSLEAMQNFDKCVVETTPAGAKKVLAMDFRTPAYRETLREIGRGHSRCMLNNSEMRGSGVLFAGSMAEALLTSETRHPLTSALAYDPARPPIEARSQSETMALCVVRADPAATARMVESLPATAAEEQAMASLSTRLPGCLAKGASMTLNRPGLRAIVSLAAYRVAVANGAVRGVSN